jgi:DNA-binding transcriptional LysR family regulator
VRAAGEGEGEVRGTVRVSASEVTGVEHLPAIFTALRRRHPALVIELRLSDRVDDLLEREADLAVRNVQPTQGGLVAQKLPSITLGLHARRDYLERRGTPSTLADLAHHDLIGFDRETPTLRALVQRFPALARPSHALRTDSNLAQLAAIRAGFGIGMCQVPVARHDPDLVRVLQKDVAVEMGLWIVMHEDLKTSPHCRAVFAALAEGLSAL